MKPHFACDYKILLIDKDLEREVAVIASGSARRGTMIKASADLTGFAAGRYYIKTINSPWPSLFSFHFLQNRSTNSPVVTQSQSSGPTL